ncbi:transcriptional antiterminator [Shewanella sp. SNU WT4]|uniref:Rho-binding antiterminator n=1 Tax=Shewanella sp. SNU WT4 TaxID=2590015 RepID=UPI0011281F27|nr:Rho-binding antiterminator [Shewanella sp. SNU WT4]QDF67123.1 transcriptional antiterminator [Shewanella sp. SNU WT4]
MLDCHLHDHIEIMCMHHEIVLVYLMDGSKVAGVAKDTRCQSQQEFLQLVTDQGLLEVPLLDIAMVEIKPASAQPHKIWFKKAIN